MKRTVSLAAIVFGIMLISTSAFATMQWYKTFTKTYKPASGSALKNAQCAVCHMKPNGQGELNPYGKELKGKKISDASLKAIEKLDADKDGFSNIKEIKSGTLPGNANSKPAHK